MGYRTLNGTYTTDAEALNFIDGSTVHVLIIARADADCYYAEGHQNKYFSGYLTTQNSIQLKPVVEALKDQVDYNLARIVRGYLSVKKSVKENL